MRAHKFMSLPVFMSLLVQPKHIQGASRQGERKEMQHTVRNRNISIRGCLLLLLPVLVFALAVVPAAAQTAPLAGTAIGNQASATYTDASNAPRTATSNLVQTIVQQVASFMLTADGANTDRFVETHARPCGRPEPVVAARQAVEQFASVMSWCGNKAFMTVRVN